jgi:hypothetical protein
VTTIRRRRVRESTGDPQQRWIHFAPGRYGDTLVIDPARCPNNIAARGHWRHDPDGEPVWYDLRQRDVVLGVCLHERPEADNPGSPAGTEVAT